MNTLKSFLLCVAVDLAVAGCAVVPGPGDTEGTTPPRLMVKNDVMTWDDPRAFGPVPENLTATSQAVCASLNTKDAEYVARGYHRGALGADGQPFKGGGYYCVGKQSSR